MNNIGQLKLKLREYYNTGAYFDEIDVIAKKAMVFIQNYNKKIKNSCIVLDIDETCI